MARGPLRSMLLTLAVLAVAIRVLIPSGFMVRAEADGGFPLIICTGQGEMVVAATLLGDPHKAPADSDRHDSPCAFAGHGVAAEPPVITDVRPVVFTAFTPLAPSLHRDLTPGRGLAAPPLPARGPPPTI